MSWPVYTARPSTTIKSVAESILKEKISGSINDLADEFNTSIVQKQNFDKLKTNIESRLEILEQNLNDKKYYAIAFPNIQNGFEIRNKYVKMSIFVKVK